MVRGTAEGKEAEEKINLATKSDRDAGGAGGEYCLLDRYLLCKNL